MDITSEVEAWGELENYFEAPVNSARYEDKYYGVPYYSNCLAIMYNKDIFDEMGLEYPDSNWTWDDFKDMTAKTKMCIRDRWKTAVIRPPGLFCHIR